MAKNLMEQVDELLKKGRAKIGFGLAKPDQEIIASLKKAEKYADIVIVGTKVPGFECKTPKNPEEELARMLAEGEVDGIVRGTIDDFKTFEAFLKFTDQKQADFFEPGYMEDAHGRQFFLYPASNPTGWTNEEKIKEIENSVGFMKKYGIKPKIGVITGERHETYKRRKAQRKGVVGILNKTYEDAEELVKYLTKKGIEAKNYAIEINTAVEENCNFIIMPNGMVGNQVFRAVCFLGGGKLLIVPRIGPKNFVYEDNSRNEKDYLNHVKYAVAWANNKK